MTFGCFLISSSLVGKGDVEALRYLYKNLGYPSRLAGWTSDGVDPGQEPWNGVSCNETSIRYILKCFRLEDDSTNFSKSLLKCSPICIEFSKSLLKCSPLQADYSKSLLKCSPLYADYNKSLLKMLPFNKDY